MKILVVGSTGFVGQNLVQYLTKQSIDFCCLDRKQNTHVESYTWQELQNVPFASISTVFFLTGKAHDLKKTADDQAYFDINVGLLETFVEAAEKQSFGGKLVYISSVKAVADRVEDVLTEQDQPNPETVYGKSKLQAEQFLSTSYLKAQTYIIRPCMIHGPGNKGNLNQLFNIVNKGIPNVLSAFHNERSLLSIDNLLFVFHQVIEDKLKADTYQVSDAGYLSINDMFEVIAHSIGKSYKPVKVPKFIIKALALVGDFIPLPLNSERLQKLTENYKVSNQHLLNALGKELPVSAKEGLAKTIKSFIL